MQGSIGWGINILTGRSSSGINQNQDSNENKANTSSSGSSQIALPDTTKEEVTPEPENLAQDIDTEPVLTPSVSTLEKTTHFLQHFYQTLSNDIQEDIFAQDGALFAAVILSLCALIVFAGIGMCIAKQPDYGFIQISTGIFLLFLLILFNAKISVCRSLWIRTVQEFTSRICLRFCMHLFLIYRRALFFTVVKAACCKRYFTDSFGNHLCRRMYGISNPQPYPRTACQCS